MHGGDKTGVWWTRCPQLSLSPIADEATRVLLTCPSQLLPQLPPVAVFTCQKIPRSGVSVVWRWFGKSGENEFSWCSAVSSNVQRLDSHLPKEHFELLGFRMMTFHPCFPFSKEDIKNVLDTGDSKSQL